jgi:hypothetical protein
MYESIYRGIWRCFSGRCACSKRNGRTITFSSFTRSGSYTKAAHKYFTRYTRTGNRTWYADWHDKRYG